MTKDQMSDTILAAKKARGVTWEQLAEKLRTAVAAHPFALPAGIEIACTCSIGVAAFPEGHPGAESLDVDADRVQCEGCRVLDRGVRCAQERTVEGVGPGVVRAADRRRGTGERRGRLRRVSRVGIDCRTQCGRAHAR